MRGAVGAAGCPELVGGSEESGAGVGAMRTLGGGLTTTGGG